MARKPAFARQVKERWRKKEGKVRGGRRGSGKRRGRNKRNLFERLKLFDETMVSVAKIMMKASTSRVEDNVAALAVAII